MTNKAVTTYLVCKVMSIFPYSSAKPVHISPLCGVLHELYDLSIDANRQAFGLTNVRSRHTSRAVSATRLSQVFILPIDEDWRKAINGEMNEVLRDPNAAALLLCRNHGIYQSLCTFC